MADSTKFTPSKENRFVTRSNAYGPKKIGVVNFKEGQELHIAHQQRNDHRTGMTTHVTREKAAELEEGGYIEPYSAFEARKQREAEERQAVEV